MKKLKTTIKMLAVMTLCTFIWAACSSNEKKPKTYSMEEEEGEASPPTPLQKERGEMEEGEKGEGGECVELSLKDLLDLLRHYDEPQRAARTGLALIYQDEMEGDEVGCTEMVYGHDIEKGEKEELGYQLKGTADHCCYFQINLDTSTNPCLNFGDKGDAEQFFERMAKTEPTAYEGKTYYIHKKDGEEALYVDVPYDEGEYETYYLIYPPEREEGFYRIRIDVWM